MTVKEFFGEKVEYDPAGQKIWAVDRFNNYQMVADVRGWGAIQNLYSLKNGRIEIEKAAAFQDGMGEFIATAINEKLKQESKEVTLKFTVNGEEKNYVFITNEAGYSVINTLFDDLTKAYCENESFHLHTIMTDASGNVKDFDLDKELLKLKQELKER